ncbi:hypothetical protein SAMN05216174_101495 [Actinokineospora iranica]|uniref:Uncharacterized protein n=1 Tax=Actinokineospora iranica TaxID=1271860 RepID=A0A1G6JNX7_9PSEU|nr:hypothetical protein SAMN05216174_101495 [Actinokineospora iranica]
MAAYLCDPSGPFGFLSAVSFTLWRWLQVWWPLLTVAAALALAAGALLARAVRLARRNAADAARWVEITPPASLPRDGAPAWWRSLAGMLHRTARRGIDPRHLAVEFVADADGVRAGVWVPPELPVRRVAELVGHVWPGARAQVTDPPRWTDTAGPGRVSAAEVYPAGGQWVPLAEPATRTSRPVEVGTDDVLRGLFSALSDCGPGEQRCVQLIVTPEFATGRPGAADRPWWLRAIAGGFRLLGRGVLGVLDLFTSSRPSGAPTVRTDRPAPDPDPVIEAGRRAITAKKAHGPHLRVSVRVVHHTAARGSRRTRQGQRRVVAGLAGGFDLAAPLATFRLHRVGGGVGGARRVLALVDQRRPARRRYRFAVTITELAGLWHLPAEPTQYGMADAVGRVRRPSRGLPRVTRRRPGGRADQRRPDDGRGGQGARRDAA